MEEGLLLTLVVAVRLWSSSSSSSSEVGGVGSSLELMVLLGASLMNEEGHLLMLGAAACSSLMSVGAAEPCSCQAAAVAVKCMYAQWKQGLAD
jgi:hypothetical protein